VTLRERVVPQPYVTLAIIALWMMLASSPSLGNLLLGSVIGLAIPHLTQNFWPDRPQTFRAGAAIKLFLVVLGDIIVANINVARLVLGPLSRLKPAFIEIPLDTDSDFVATILGSIITLTPGTVSIDIDRERRILHVHALDVEDTAALVSEIKTRYEAPLKEIFGC